MAEQPTSRQLVSSWLRVSLQSFGGGTATLALIRREFVVHQRWVSEADFTRDWSMCQLAPGINLIALAILIGKRTGGAVSILIAMAGLLLPSFAITLCLTAVYARYSHSALVGSAMRGVLPAVAGIGLATAFGMGTPLVSRFPRGELVSYGVLFALCLAVTLIWHPPTIQVLIGGGLLGAGVNLFWDRRQGGGE